MTYYYRYTADPEKEFIDENGWIRSLSELTFLSPDVYDDAIDAEERLAMPARPRWRIGPIASEAIPRIAVGLRRVRPKFGKRGGGWEIATSGRIPYPNAVRLR